MLENLRLFLRDNITCAHSDAIITALLLAVIALVALIMFFVLKQILVLVEKLVAKSDTSWDDDLINSGFLNAAAQIAPAIVVRMMLPPMFGSEAKSVHWLDVATSFYIIWAVVYMLVVFIGNLYTAFEHRPKLKAYAVKGFFQMFKLIVVGIGAIVALSLLVGREPLSILAGLGAAAGVTMLVFKDTILGLVASVQLTANKMLHKGDWIIAEKHNANGEVEDITLTAVKVRNWDNSVSTIPPYSLVTDSFRNYQPMRRSGGRLVDRSVFIDMNTVRFCTPDEVTRFTQEGWLDESQAAGAARHVNLSLLRIYLERYLNAHEDVNHGMLTMVRQMAPTQSGLPLQLYFFTRVTEWKEYERVQCEIFDHVYAVIREFGIGIFQTPAGTDISGCHFPSTGSQR